MNRILNILVVIMIITVSSFSQKVIYSTFIGGNGDDDPINVIIDKEGCVYVTGMTSSTNFPVRAGAYKTIRGNTAGPGAEDIFVMKFNKQMNELIYCTYIGGDGPDFPWTAAVDDKGCFIIGGQTASADYPVTANAFQKKFKGPDFRHAEGIVSKLSADGSQLLYSTFLGGKGIDVTSITPDGKGNTYVGICCSASGPFSQYESDDFLTDARSLMGNREKGDNYFVMVLNEAMEVVDKVHIGPLGANIFMDKTGDVCIIGTTGKQGLPVTKNAIGSSYNGGSDIYILKLNPSLDTILYASYLGGQGDEELAGWPFPICAFNQDGNLYLTGKTKSAGFPITSDSYGNVFQNDTWNSFVTRLSSGLDTIVSSTFFGKDVSVIDFIGIDSKKRPVIYGVTKSAEYPVTSNAINQVYHSFKDIDMNEGDRFLTIFDPALTKLEYSSFIGGVNSLQRGQWGCATIDKEDNIYICGTTTIPNFPVTHSAFDTTFNNGIDAFLMKFNLNK